MTITLEESDVFAAWVAVKEVADHDPNGNANETTDQKGNLRPLFEYARLVR